MHERSPPCVNVESYRKGILRWLKKQEEEEEDEKRDCQLYTLEWEDWRKKQNRTP